MAYEINYDDKRFTEVEADKKAAIKENDKLYGGMTSNSDKYYQDQIEASKDWADKQTQLQQEQTDFAIQKVEQQKDQAKKDYTKEQSGAYVDWQKQSDQYGANAEQRAFNGMTTTGFSESSQVSMYNTYQNRVATAREAYSRAVQNYDNAITEARLQNNSALAEIAYKALQQQLELSLQGFQYKNTLLLEQANRKFQIESEYNKRYQDVLNQINTENALAEDIRQFNEQLDWEKYQFNYHNGLGEFAVASSGGGGGGGGGGNLTARDRAKLQAEKNDTGGDDGGGEETGPPVNLKSVLNSGLGPASGTTIANAVKSGTHSAKQIGNQVYIASNTTPKSNYQGKAILALTKKK